MNFSTSQNRQIFVINAAKATAFKSTLALLQAAKPGLGYKAGGNDVEGHYLLTMGHGGVVKSDYVKPASIMWATATAPADMKHALKSVKLTLDANVNEGLPVASQDYILRVVFKQGAGFSDEDSYIKNAAVRAFSGMTAAQFYTEMAASLVRNFSKVYCPLIEVSNGTKVAVRAGKKNGATALFAADGTEVAFTTAIYLNEASQENEWVLGTKQLQTVDFQVIPTEIKLEGEDVIWGVVEDNTETYAKEVKNGYMIADLEYFCMGERADQYRLMGWPNNIITKYLVDPVQEYYCLDIHYAYQGTCEDIQKSEKTLTIVATAKDVLEDIKTLMAIPTACVKESPNY